MAKVPIGGKLVLMQGFARQKAVARDPKKKARTIAFREYVVPSETPYSLEARIALAEAAIEMRGRTFEEVVANVMKKCSGHRYKPEEVKRAEKEARYAAADANIRRMKEKLRELQMMGRAAVPVVRELAGAAGAA